MEITQSIGSVEQFGFLLDGCNVAEQGILLGGVIDEDGSAAPPHYLVNEAWEQDGVIYASLVVVRHE